MFAKEVYINRRNVLKTKVGSGILLFLGTGEAAVNYAGNAYRILIWPLLSTWSPARRLFSATMSISTISSGWDLSR